MPDDALKNFKSGLGSLFSSLNKESTISNTPVIKKKSKSGKTNTSSRPSSAKSNSSNTMPIAKANSKIKPKPKPKLVSQQDKLLWAALNGKKMEKPIIQDQIIDKEELTKQLEEGKYLPVPKGTAVNKLEDEEDYYLSDDDVEVKKSKIKLKKKKEESHIALAPQKREKFVPKYQFNDRPSKMMPVSASEEVAEQPRLKTQHRPNQTNRQERGPFEDDFNDPRNVSNEIQKLFNRNYSQYEYDDYGDDDDMEASAADIKREEMRRYLIINIV